MGAGGVKFGSNFTLSAGISVGMSIVCGASIVSWLGCAGPIAPGTTTIAEVRCQIRGGLFTG
jgi:hypothetical protein